ncbi:MAG: aminopeptidase P family protein [Lachnospiraceae bacterium]|nr:aminopeptidase P family protein [Lachnospiraceae bacterium]
MLDAEKSRKIYAQMKEDQMQYLIVSDISSINYLIGKRIHPGERMMVLLFDSVKEKAVFVLSKLFPQEEDLGCPILYFDDVDDYVGMLAAQMPECGTVGIDKEWPARFLLRLMELQPQNRFINGSYVVDHIRQIKSAEEQELMIASSRMNDEAMRRLIPLTGKGYSEVELAKELGKIYTELGADANSFEPICCYGANAADPHHSINGTRGKKGDSVIFDIGCKLKGYCSDMTRTVFLGSVSEEQKKVYEIVKEANLRAIAAVKPGVRFCDVDAAARDYITEQGYGPQFIHRTGHNIGQDTHEYGDVSSANTNVLKPGMTFSIEPGIYLSGDFGVRIEDLVLVTEDGCRVLNEVSKELTVVEME